jgi:hypothetical protein
VKLKSIGQKLRPSTSFKVQPPAKRADPFYASPEHVAWRTDVIAAARGLCQDDQHQGANPPRGRLFADHIKERKDGGAPFDRANGMARCGSCHTRKTMATRATRLGLTRG